MSTIKFEKCKQVFYIKILKKKFREVKKHVQIDSPLYIRMSPPENQVRTYLQYKPRKFLPLMEQFEIRNYLISVFATASLIRNFRAPCMCESVFIFTHPENFRCAKIETFQILHKYIPIQLYYISCIQGEQKFLQLGVCTIESQ